MQCYLFLTGSTISYRLGFVAPQSQERKRNELMNDNFVIEQPLALPGFANDPTKSNINQMQIQMQMQMQSLVSPLYIS